MARGAACSRAYECLTDHASALRALLAAAGAAFGRQFCDRRRDHLGQCARDACAGLPWRTRRSSVRLRPLPPLYPRCVTPPGATTAFCEGWLACNASIAPKSANAVSLEDNPAFVARWQVQLRLADEAGPEFRRFGGSRVLSRDLSAFAGAIQQRQSSAMGLIFGRRRSLIMQNSS